MNYRREPLASRAHLTAALAIPDEDYAVERFRDMRDRNDLVRTKGSDEFLRRRAGVLPRSAGRPNSFASKRHGAVSPTFRLYESPADRGEQLTDGEADGHGVSIASLNTRLRKLDIGSSGRDAYNSASNSVAG